jgi:hypothetical protein
VPFNQRNKILQQGTDALSFRKSVIVHRATNMEVFIMKKVWSKPAMCQVEAGFEISRYLPAEVSK